MTPEEWRETTLGEIVDVVGGGTPKREVPDYWDGDIPWATPSDITALRGRSLSETESSITAKGLSDSSAKLLPPGTILMTSRATIGACAIAKTAMATNQGFQNLVPSGSVSSFFLLYLAQSLRSELTRRAAGSTFLEISNKGVKAVPIALPPLPEQRKIAAILSSVDEVIEKTECVIEQLQVVKKTMVKELLISGVPGRHTHFKQTEIGEIPEEWEVAELADVVSKTKHAIVDGPFGSNLKSKHYRSSGVPVIQSGSVTTGEFVADEYIYVDESLFRAQARSAVSAGDIVMAKIGARAGTCARMPEGHPLSILAGNSLKISPDDSVCKGDFLVLVLTHYYKTGVLQKLRTTTAQPAMNLKGLRRLLIPLPKPSEQEEILRACGALSRTVRAEGAVLDQLESCKAALMSVLLTGEVRVTPDEEAA